jgi:peptidyl-prolyl cis-trans isomerase D
MLEAIRERAQGLFVKIILALLIVPFALWGVDSYIRHATKESGVAKVDGQNITRQEFGQVMKQQQERLRAMMGAAFDPALLDRPEVKRSVLDNLISERLLAMQAAKVGLNVPDALLAKIISGVPDFQENGQFSQARYEAVLRNQGMTPAMFEARLRQNIAIEQLSDGLVRAAFLSRSTQDRLIGLIEQQREISQVSLRPEAFMGQVKVEPAAVQAYYDKHRDEFRTPEQVRVEYAVLSVDELAPQMTVSDEEIKKYYEEHLAQYQEPERRQASHILISVPADASAAQKEAARAKAEQVAKEAMAKPGSFAELAKRYSQDPGSAAKGGDLGYFPRGAMVKAFSDAVFKMSQGEIAGPVQSEFGYHIIKLTGIKPAKTRSLDQVRDEVALELRKQQAAKKFAELADSFSNTVYEQADSLKPAADALKLKIQTSSWISRNGGDEPLLSNPKLLQAIFSDDTLKQKRNTEAIEVAPNTLVSARVADYKAASYRPFEEVSGQIISRLQREQAAALAAKQGKDWLAQLQKGEVVAEAKWSTPALVTRQTAANLGEAAVNQIFRADAGKLPAYVGVDSPQGGYTLIKIGKVVTPAAVDEAKKKAYAGQLQQMLGQEYFAAYLAGLREKTEISINQAMLEKTER